MKFGKKNRAGSDKAHEAHPTVGSDSALESMSSRHWELLDWDSWCDWAGSVAGFADV